MWVFVLCAVVPGLMVVMVLMVAMAFWGAPLRGMLEGRSEQVACWPGVMGVQFDYGGGAGGAGGEGEEEAAVGGAGGGEGDEGGGVGVGAGEGQGAGAG